jgi:hypothetical protein
LRLTLEDEAEALQIQARGHRSREVHSRRVTFPKSSGVKEGPFFFCCAVCEPLLACEAGLLETNFFPMLPSLRL